MNLLEGIKSAIKSLYLNKIRSLLTMLGIIVGISSVILMSGIGNGIKGNIINTLKKSSIGNFTIYADYKKKNYKDKYELSKKTIDFLNKQDYILAASPTTYKKIRLEINKKNYTSVLLQGTSKDYEIVLPFEISKGRGLTDSELKSSKNLVTIDSILAKDLFQDENPIGKKINIKIEGYDKIIRNENFYIYGIFDNPTEGAGILGAQLTEKLIRMPMKKYNQFIGSNKIEVIIGKVKNPKNLNENIKQIKKALENDGKSNGIYMVRRSANMVDIENFLNKFQLFILSVVFISLFVGGIGIMNIMLASVQERIKEIGIRKSIGASNKDILIQFLIESIFLSLLGGIIGIFVGVILANLVSLVIQIKPVFTINIIIFSVLTSSIVGILFGLIPAKKASKLNPIDALRNE